MLQQYSKCIAYAACLVACMLPPLVHSASSTASANFNIVESVPSDLSIWTEHTTYEAWLEVLDNAQQNITVVCFYVTLTGGNSSLGGNEGQYVYDAFKAAAERGVYIRFITNAPNSLFPQQDVLDLQQGGYIDAVFLDFNKLFGAGLIHTKMIVGDSDAFYIGSANLDWRSLTQVKELGYHMWEAPAIASDLLKIADTLWIVGKTGSVPSVWPTSLDNAFNLAHPMPISMNGTDGDLVVSLSPPPLRPAGWTPDEDSITSAMMKAQSTVCIEVMDYAPAIVYTTPSTYWPIIDTAMRVAAYNNQTQFRILIGYWSHSAKTQGNWLWSLNDIPNIEVKYFEVPQLDPPVDYARVNHAKYMVTDNAVYVGTSNWSGDYFVNTHGVGIWTTAENAIKEAQTRFDRDWKSEYVHDMPILN